MVKPFAAIYQHVLDRLGSKAAVEACLEEPHSRQQLLTQPDSFYLSAISRRVFRAGLKHSLVDAKWPAFEQAFRQFNPIVVARMSDEDLDQLMANRALIRHWSKLKSVRSNAVMVLDIAAEHDSVGQWLADWPDDDVVGLWQYLKNNGAQLGGNSAAYFLRMVGRDTFILTSDVVAALVAQGVVDKKPTSQKALRDVQAAFNAWQQQSGLPLCQISRLLAMTVNY